MEKIYFASDFHLGVPDYRDGLERELKIICWSDLVKQDEVDIFLSSSTKK